MKLLLDMNIPLKYAELLCKTSCILDGFTVNGKVVVDLIKEEPAK